MTAAKLKADTARMMRLDELKPYPGNANVGDVEAIAESLEANKQYRPIVVNIGGKTSRMTILAGNHTARAAEELGWSRIRVWLVDVDDDHARRINLADNRIASKSTTDEPALAVLLAAATADGDDGLAGTGYSSEDVDAVLANLGAGDEAEVEPELPPVPKRATTKRGQIVELGEHRLLCGDAADKDAVASLLEGEDVDLILTSPPYNVDVTYGGTAEGRAGWEQYGAFLRGVLDVCVPTLAPGRAVAWNIGTAASVYPYRQAMLLEDVGLTYLRQLIWQKQGVPLPKWHFTKRKPKARQFTPDPTHEIVYLFANAAKMKLGRSIAPVDDLAAHDVFRLHQSQAMADTENDPAAGRTGSSQSQALKTRARKSHPAAFPVRFAEIFVRHLAGPGEIVLDPFAGAGTVALAAERLKRRARLIEIEPVYCDVIAERWERATGEKAVRRKA